MKDLLRIYVLWHPLSEFGHACAQLIAKHFDGLGMERDGVAYRVPVRFRSEAWDAPSGSSAPAQIPWEDAGHNAVVFLHDKFTEGEKETWDDYIRNARQMIRDRNNIDMYIPFQCCATCKALPSDGTIQYARQFEWADKLSKDPEAKDKRLLLHVLHRVRTHLRRLAVPNAKLEPLFVSHAKADGDETAWGIVSHVNSKGQDVPLDTFYDAKELMPGEDYQERFKEEIGRGTLLAIVSDIYDSRPWCVFELTEAKRKLRPIVLADVSRLRTTRTYPYGANLPRQRYNASGQAAIEMLLVEALSEGLRCDLFVRQAQLRLMELKRNCLVLPRPPELFDLIERTNDQLGSIVVYPDPPIPNVEREIIDRALKRLSLAIEIKTLAELL
jgi:hypothetical protein